MARERDLVKLKPLKGGPPLNISPQERILLRIRKHWFILAVYNILFLIYSRKAKSELVIALPVILNNLLRFNIVLSIVVILFITFVILKGVL